MYGNFIREVRAINMRHPRDRRLRVLLGDPPVDWDRIHRIEDLLPWAFVRDSHPAAVIQREVLAKRRRALVVYGDAHLRRKHMGTNYQIENPITKSRLDGRTVVDLLEVRGEQVFSIAVANVDLQPLQPNIATWPVPSIVLLRGTTLLFYLGPPASLTKAALPHALRIRECRLHTSTFELPLRAR